MGSLSGQLSKETLGQNSQSPATASKEQLSGPMFCGICGGKTSKHQPMSWWCDNCQQRFYDSPHPCADMFLFDEKGRLLVTRRGTEPNKGQLDIPGGFVDFNETFEEAAKREIKEELGLSEDDYSKPVYFTSYLADYPWKKVTYQCITTAFAAQLKPDIKPEALEEIDEILWLKKADIDASKFSFQGHIKAMAAAAKAAGIENW